MIYIEAPEAEAKVIFYNRFGHNPERITCTCCGEDYSISESDDLLQLTGYHRGCLNVTIDSDGKRYTNKEIKYDKEQGWVVKASGKPVAHVYVDEPAKERYRKYITLDEYVLKEDVLVIYAKDIKDEERVGEVPEQGYVWVD